MTEMYSLAALEATSQNQGISRGAFPLEDLGKDSPLSSPAS